MKRIGFISLLCFALGGLAADREHIVGFKQIKLGAPLSSSEHARFSCAPTEGINAVAGDYFCVSCAVDRPECGETIAGVPVQPSLFLIDDQVISIQLRFPSASFDTVADALRARYGEPSDRKRSSTFYEDELRWVSGDSVLVAKRYSSSLDSSRVMFYSRSGTAKARVRDAAKSGKGAGDTRP